MDNNDEATPDAWNSDFKEVSGSGCVPWERKEGTEIFYSLQFKQWDQVSVVKPEQVGREILVKKKGIIIYWVCERC